MEKDCPKYNKANRKRQMNARVSCKMTFQIYCKDSRNMDEIEDESVHLIVTSPPYNVGMEYESKKTLKEHLDILKNVRWLK